MRSSVEHLSRTKEFSRMTGDPLIVDNFLIKNLTNRGFTVKPRIPKGHKPAGLIVYANQDDLRVEIRGIDISYRIMFVPRGTCQDSSFPHGVRCLRVRLIGRDDECAIKIIYMEK